jgi:hypothetical protein
MRMKTFLTRSRLNGAADEEIVLDGAGQMRRVDRDDARVVQAGGAADGVEQVADQHHVQHLFTRDVANQAGNLRVGGAVQAVAGGQVRRDRRQLQFKRGLQHVAQAVGLFQPREQLRLESDHGSAPLAA